MNKTSIIINKKEFRKLNDIYYISNDGQVYSTYCRKILKPLIYTLHGKSYKYINITLDSKRRNYKIHRLVYKTWIGDLEDKEQVNHKDDNSLNNYYKNLYKGSQKDNIQDCINNDHRVGNVFYLTVYDKSIDKILTFCPSSNFIEYCKHPNASRSVNKYFNKNWFKKRYQIIDFQKINNLDEYRSVTTKSDECNSVE